MSHLTLVPPAVIVHPTVAAYLARLPAERSRRLMAQALDHVASILLARPATAVDVPWQELTPAHVGAIVAALASSAPATANLRLSALRGVIRTLGRLDLITAEQERRLLDFKLYANNRPLAGRCLTTDEIRRLFAAATTPRDAAVLALAYFTGMRRDEIASATWGWVIEDGAVIRVVGKGRKIRDVPLSTAARAWLPPRGADDAPIVHRLSKHGTTRMPLTGGGIYGVLQMLGTAAGIAHFSPHDLRRTFVTELLARFVDPITVARMAGHANVKTTMRYDRRPADVARAAAELLSDGLPLPFVAPVK